MFLATPHQGIDISRLGETLRKLASRILPDSTIDTKSQLLSTLDINNETLQNINTQFLEIYGRFQMYMAHEARKATFESGGEAQFIVDPTSASLHLPGVIYFGIEATHDAICQFESARSPGYLNVAIGIKTWVDDCTEIIQQRWAEEKRNRTVFKQRHAIEMMESFDMVEEVTEIRNLYLSREATNSYRLVSEGRQKTLGIEHADTLESQQKLADTLHDLKRYKDAEALYREVVQGRQKTLGIEHADTLDSQHNLRRTLRCLKWNFKWRL